MGETRVGFRARGVPSLHATRALVRNLLSTERVHVGFFDAAWLERLKARLPQPGFRAPHLDTEPCDRPTFTCSSKPRLFPAWVEGTS